MWPTPPLSPLPLLLPSVPVTWVGLQPQLYLPAGEKSRTRVLRRAAPAGGTHSGRWHTAVSGDIWMSTISSN